MYPTKVLDASAPIRTARDRLAGLARDLPRYRNHLAAAESALARRQQRGATPGQLQAAFQNVERARRRVVGTEAAIAEVQAELPVLEARHAEVWKQERSRLDAAAEAAKAETIRKREARETDRRKWIDVHARQAGLKRRFGHE